MASAGARHESKAQRFFWCWLIVATAVSIAGNVSHALLVTAHTQTTANPWVAGALAIVPPVVQVGATHGVHVLVRARIVGAAYRCALVITVALVIFAFVLSFEALRELAIVYAGMNPVTAWLWPLVIDLSITGSTVSLLALTGVQRSAQAHEAGVLADSTDSYAGLVEEWQSIDGDGEREREDLAGVDWQSTDSAGVEWRHQLRAAESLVNEGVTRIGRNKVAQVLHAHHEGVRPSAIARNLNVGYRTVIRILDHHPGEPVGIGV